MAKPLNGVRVALLATHGFEESELTSPRQAVMEAGGDVDVIAPESRQIRAWAKTQWSETYPVDRPLSEASASEYRGLLLPGGLFNPDTLRTDEQALAFVRAFFEHGKPVGAICHAPWILINAEVVAGRRMTSVASIKVDLRNAGANWVDEAVVTDAGLVTSRTPGDLGAFNAKCVEELAEGRHSRQHA